MASRQMVVFTVNEEDFGVDIAQVLEIIRPVEVFKIPNTPDYIEGLINLRGKVHTVISLRKRFNLPVREFDDGTKVIIVSVGSMVLGFIVDEVKEIIRIDEENIESTPQVLTPDKNKYVNGVAKTDDRIVLLLNLESTLSVTEKEE